MKKIFKIVVDTESENSQYDLGQLEAAARANDLSMCLWDITQALRSFDKYNGWQGKKVREKFEAIKDVIEDYDDDVSKIREAVHEIINEYNLSELIEAV